MCEVRDVLDELQELRLGPLEVIDREDHGPVGRESLQEHADRPERLLRRGSAAGDADRLPDTIRDAISVLRGTNQCRELGPSCLRAICFVEVRDVDQRFGQRPERDALSVRQAASAEDGRAITEFLDEGRQEPRLAYAGDAEDREELTRLVRRSRSNAPGRKDSSRARPTIGASRCRANPAALGVTAVRRNAGT